MWVLVAKALSFFAKAQKFLGFMSPRNIIFKQLINNIPQLKKLSGMLNLTPKGLLMKVANGEIDKALQTLNKTNPTKAKEVLRKINKLANGKIKEQKERERLEAREARDEARRFKKQQTLDFKNQREYLRVQNALEKMENRKQHPGDKGIKTLRDKQERRTKSAGKKEAKEVNKVLSNYVVAYFISEWTHEGTYNKRTRTATLRHGNKWYTYPNFPWKWFKLMLNGQAPGGYGAGSVWWAKYKKNAKVAARIKGNPAMEKYW